MHKSASLGPLFEEYFFHLVSFLNFCDKFSKYHTGAPADVPKSRYYQTFDISHTFGRQ